MTDVKRAPWLRSPLFGNPFAARADVERACLDLARPVLPYLKPSAAGALLGGISHRYADAGAQMEAAARLLWGLAPLACHAQAPEPLNRLLKGLAHGADPEHPDYWGPINDCDQRMVEMAAVGFALAILPPHRLDLFDAASRANLVRYFDQLNRHEPVDNNWHFFRIFANLGVAALGGEMNAAAMEASFARIDSFALDEGWYRDGPTEQKDYYVAFAFHFYGLIYATLRADADPVRAQRFRERARAFAPRFARFFGPDGAAIPFGRSMTYRFAQAAFFGALAFAGEEVLPWGVLKGLYLRHMRWWSDKPISDRDGVLALGYGYPNPLMNEQYNASGSPYWAMKAFLPLALPQDHPFWTADERPFEPGDILPLRAGAALVETGRHAVLYPAGQSNMKHRGGADKYARFAYSSAFGFSVEVMDRLDLMAGDNMLLLSDDGGAHVRRRESSAEWHIADRWSRCRWQPWSDVTVTTWLAPLGDWHVRVHLVDTPRALVAAEGGFCLPIDDGDGFVDHWMARELERPAFFANGFGASGIVDLDGHRRPAVIMTLPNTNLIHRKTIVPRLTGAVPAGRTLLRSAIFARPGADGAALFAHPPLAAHIAALFDHDCPAPDAIAP
jgi:hypothetical protein